MQVVFICMFIYIVIQNKRFCIMFIVRKSYEIAVFSSTIISIRKIKKTSKRSRGDGSSFSVQESDDVGEQRG
jgi:hypothetical protein